MRICNGRRREQLIFAVIERRQTAVIEEKAIVRLLIHRFDTVAARTAPCLENAPMPSPQRRTTSSAHMIRSIGEIEQEPRAKDQAAEHEQGRETSEQDRCLLTTDVSDLRHDHVILFAFDGLVEMRMRVGRRLARARTHQNGDEHVATGAFDQLLLVVGLLRTIQ